MRFKLAILMLFRAGPVGNLRIMNVHWVPLAAALSGLLQPDKSLAAHAFGGIQPVISPDGRTVALSYQGAICRMSSEGGTLRRLTHGENWDVEPTWSPDGKQIAFINAPGLNAGPLRVIMAEDAAPVKLEKEILARGRLQFHPDGKRLLGIFALTGQPDRLQWLDLSSGTLTSVNIGQRSAPVWALSADGSSILFVTFQDRAGEQTGNNGPSADVWRIAAQGGEPQKVVRWPSRIYNLCWDAEGRGAYVVTDRGVPYNDIWHIPLDRPLEGARKITFGQADEDWPSVSADGRWLVHTENHEGATALVRVDLKSGERKTLSVDGVEFGEGTGKLRLTIKDAHTGEPLAARISVRGNDGKFHFPFAALYRLTSGVGHFYARKQAELTVPTGKFTVQAWHGPEYFVEAEEIEIAADTTREVTLALDRWSDMPSRGWFSGENHVHANYGYGAWHNGPATIREQCEGEDLHVANVVVANSDGDGVFDRQYFLGRPDPLSAARTIIYWNEEFRSTIWGHLTLGNLSQLVEPIFTGFKETTNPWDIPSNADIAERTRAQSGTVSYTHPSQNPDALYDGAYTAKGLPVDAALGRIDTMDVMGFGYEASLRLWYRLLNCGFRIPAAAGTDVFLNRITSYPPGWGRCYVKVTNGLSYAEWMGGQKAGRSFITMGPMLEWTADGREPGDTLRPGGPSTVRVRARASSQFPMKRVEIVVNGTVVSTNHTANSDRDWMVDQAIKIERAGWIAVRCGSGNTSFPVGSTLAAHGNPVYVDMRGRPQDSYADAQYFLAWIERLEDDLKKRDRIPFGLEHIAAQIETARGVYRELAGDAATLPAAVRAVDLNVNETQEVNLGDGTLRMVKLIRLDETRDSLRDAVRQARVQIAINGQSLVLTSATYHLPVSFAGVQMDCPITKGHVGNSSEGNAWGLLKDARIRLWPAGSPWIEPGTFVYPLKQRWFATHTQMANEPSYVDGGEDPGRKKIYYHYGLDCGGAEGMVDVIAATKGQVISSGTNVLAGYADSPAKPRYDVVYLRDDRGWYYRYSHLQTIDAAMRPGAEVSMGQKVGVLGKEGGSGGWSHLHFDITSRQPSGMWGIQEGYAFLREAYQREYAPKIIAVARPHHFVFRGEKVVLDGSKSWSKSGKIIRYDWTFTDGSTANGAAVERTYSRSGEYSEILKITDATGEVDYDFATVLVIDKSAPEQLPPTIHPAFSPTLNIRAGDPITFKVRSFRTTHGNEVWDFDDGSERVTVKSDGNVEQHAKDGYAVTEHRFAKAGHYMVRVERTNERGQRAIAHLHVPVEGR